MNSVVIYLYGSCLIGMMALLPTLLSAQQELKNADRARYADVSYTKLGFGEVNQKLLSTRQARRLNRRIHQMQREHGVVVVFVSLVAEEVNDWEKGQIQGLPRHFWGKDPRVARHHVTLLFDEHTGRNWVMYGSDNTTDFAAHTKTLHQLFVSSYRNGKTYRPISKLLKRIKHIYARLPAQRKYALSHPQLSSIEWVALARAEMDISQDYGSAVRHLEKAIALDSTNSDARMLLGYAHIELGDWKPAGDALESAWSLDSSFETAIGQLTLHYLLRDTTAVERWAHLIREFDVEFKEQICRMTQYENEDFFIGNAAQKVFNTIFQPELQRQEPKGSLIFILQQQE